MFQSMVLMNLIGSRFSHLLGSLLSGPVLSSPAVILPVAMWSHSLLFIFYGVSSSHLAYETSWFLWQAASNKFSKIEDTI